METPMDCVGNFQKVECDRNFYIFFSYPEVPKHKRASSIFDFQKPSKEYLLPKTMLQINTISLNIQKSLLKFIVCQIK